MCLALPAEVTAIEEDTATVMLEGVMMPVSLSLLDDVQVGDFVIVHVGFALSKVDPDLAREQLALMAQGGVSAQESAA